ncbi:MAG: succinate dehydrogenase, cytochrome b556 subunit [Gammaproteobacteria bacterium]|nr:succinate dehydrogenase, cytochrome b556 subunit [Gammaproteobacteria bacterium]
MTDQRPLSPHLTIYRRQLTSVLSIFHRATGVFLSISMVLLVIWLVALATGAERYATVRPLLESVPARLVLLGGLWSFFYHLSNGIRHLFWDAGMGFEIKQTYASGWAVVGASVLLTAGTLVYALAGGAA